ncbi:type I polyketide synthase [Nocardia sp. NPDC005366]|uniref:type I polyketide synthase n=1 Tax=Nocardia sp. NPDC005366 TaxID=3156878 RepID=UPI0033A8D458
MTTAASLREPIAVVGMACRFPGGIDSPESLWRFVVEGKHISSGFPDDRSMTELANMASPEVIAAFAPRGGFIDDPGQFDPEFFGISPREARAMDPQQRVLLEVSWEALERAGIDPALLRGSDTGVYAGAMSGDYAYLIPGQKDIDPGYVSLGVSQSVLSGRISYLLGLEGPTLSVDTACSSSLVAFHLAAQGLRLGECSLALAGGVSIMSTLTGFYALGQHGAISKEGKSKPYSADADGFCMAEGAAMLVLERRCDAERNGHPILALLRGSAVNQDGASKGLTVPSTQAQLKLIRAALASAELTGADVDVVEGHGTGTPVGDPIELEALFATYGQDRPADRPVRIGSIKSNFGHTQAAAGAAGVIKVIEAMRHGVLPASLHVGEPTPSVDWSSGAVEVATELTPWPERGRPRRAGVSSFGIAGTNAHVVIEQPPAPASTALPEPPPPGVLAWPVSGRTPEALAEQASRLSAQVRAHPEYGIGDVARALATTRAAFEHRAVVLGESRDELLAGLANVAEGSPVGAVRGHADNAHRVVFVFPGQGAQWTGMAVRLIAESPVFAAQIDACEQAFAEFVDWSLRDVLHGAAGAPGLDRVDVVQPALFAVMVSTAALWRSMGIEPDAVLGHSQGEIAAAYVAGALTLSDAARIVTLRSLALRAIAGRGAMASIALSAEDVTRLLATTEGIAIAAVNGPATTVVSGDEAAVLAFAARCEAEGIRAKHIPVDYASHSAHVEAIAADIASALAPVTAHPTDIAFYSAHTGDLLEPTALGPDYWYRNLRDMVRFDDAFQAAYQSGHSAFLEMSPHPVLTAAMHESLEYVGAFTDYCVITGSVRRDDGGLRRFLTSVAEAYVGGVGVDWSALAPTALATRVDLPTYAFQRQKFWLTGGGGSGGGKPSSLGLTEAGHPLLGAMAELPSADRYQFTTRLSLATHGWIGDHALFGTVLVPGAMMLELALHVGERLGCERVDRLTMYSPITLPEQGAVHVQVVVGDRVAPGRRSIAVYSRPEVDDAAPGETLWSLHADGTLGQADQQDDVEAHSMEVWPPIGAELAIDPEAAYEGLAALGYQYGPVFQGMRAVWRRGDEVFAEVALPDSVTDAAEFGLHPALLDAAMQTGAALTALAPTDGSIRLPFAWEGVRLHAIGAAALRVRLTPAGTDRMRWLLADANGKAVATGTLQVRSVTVGALAERGLANQRESLFGVEWLPVPAPRARFTAPSGAWAVVGSSEGLDADLIAAGIGEYASVPAVIDAVDAGADIPAVLVLSRVADAADPDADLPDAVADQLARTLTQIQSWLAEERFASTRVLVLTRGTQALRDGDDISDLAGAAVWGLLRSAQSENQGRLVQLDLDAADVTLDTLSAALQTDEPEIVLRDGEFHGRRIRPAVDAAAKSAELFRKNWRLDIPSSGNVEDARLVENTEGPAELGVTEVSVRLRAGGLTYRDAVAGLAIPTGLSGASPVDGAGIVLAVGAEVTEFSPGDRVFGFFPAIAATAVTDHLLLARIPDAMSFQQAATVPVAFTTALHALRDHAALSAGDTVVIHAATGGVGSAAVTLARRMGLRVFATASRSKWETLRHNGFTDEWIADSRSAAFVERVAAATEGRGADAVLNALPDEFTEASLRTLADGGRFVEIGRSAVHDPAEVTREHPGAVYSTFELAGMEPARLGALLREVADLLRAGDIAALASTTFDVRRAAAALRHLAEARQVGKVVLTWPAPFDPAATVLITGGTGTIGALIARHLVVEYGARHLLLAGRRGSASPNAVELAAELADLGAEVGFAACDVGDRAAVRRLIDDVPGERPIGAVVHIAASLADSTFAGLTRDHLDEVLHAKAAGAWHLHELTSGLDLSMFVLFSSAAGTFGAPGQANYAAANVFLDALAQYRTHRGLPATAMAWGWWAQDTANTGQLDEKDRARLSRMGITPIPTEEALALFDSALGWGRAYAVPVGLDVSLLRAAASVAELPPLFRALLHARAKASTPMGDPAQLAKRLAGLSPEQQHAIVVEMVKVPIAMVLGYSSPDAVQPDREFTEMGIDSLSSIELGSHLRSLTGVKLANSVIFQYPTAALLARHILDQVTPEDAELAGPILAEVDMLLDRLAAMHRDREMPEDVLARLCGSIERLGPGRVRVTDPAEMA